MTTLYLKPGEGRTVDQEDGSPWPAEGMDAELSLFVRRRIADQDLIEAERPDPESTAPSDLGEDDPGISENLTEEPPVVGTDATLTETPPAAEPADTAKPRKPRASKPAGDA